MKASRRIAMQEQLRLFQVWPQDPRWEALPSRTREQVLVLLAQLLRDHQKRLLAPARKREVGNE